MRLPRRAWIAPDTPSPAPPWGAAARRPLLAPSRFQIPTPNGDGDGVGPGRRGNGGSMSSALGQARSALGHHVISNVYSF